MNRTLIPGPRPFVALGVVFGLMVVVLIAAAAKSSTEHALENLESAGFVALLYGIISFNIWRTRIVVSSQSIALRHPWGGTQEVQFKNIHVSFVRTLSEPLHPVAMEIYDSRRELPMLSLRLKPYRQRDVLWLLQLPELKVARE